MHPDEIVRVTLRGLSHDADAGLTVLLAARNDPDAVAAAIFLQILSCRFDDALDSASTLAVSGRLSIAAIAMARAVSSGIAAPVSESAPDVGPYAGLTTMLELEAAMSSGQIAAATDIALRVGSNAPPTSADQIWAGIGLVRALGFAGRFTDADEVLAAVEGSATLAGFPQLLLLARGTRIFVDGHLGREVQVDTGLGWLRDSYSETVKPDYVYAGAYALAAFGVNALGRLPEAAALMVHGGGGDNLQRLQVVDRVYGYEMLVEAALAENDAAAALSWLNRAESLPVSAHHMAEAGLSRIRARVAASVSDHDSGIRESADAGVFAALVGGDLEVVRARIIGATARAASGDRARAFDELEAAARRAESTGAAAVKAWAQRELAAHGRRLRNVPGIGWDALTPTQKVIARLAAAGLRNREIATAVYVSEKTVESHVAAVLGALGTANRVGIGREISGDDVDPLFSSSVTPRQRDVAVLVARGLSNGAISRSLGISEKTVEKHIADLFVRLQVRSRSALAARVRGASEDQH